jgi:hypothetical protein
MTRIVHAASVHRSMRCSPLVSAGLCEWRCSQLTGGGVGALSAGFTLEEDDDHLPIANAVDGSTNKATHPRRGRDTLSYSAFKDEGLDPRGAGSLHVDAFASDLSLHSFDAPSHEDLAFPLVRLPTHLIGSLYSTGARVQQRRGRHGSRHGALVALAARCGSACHTHPQGGEFGGRRETR